MLWLFLNRPTEVIYVSKIPLSYRRGTAFSAGQKKKTNSCGCQDSVTTFSILISSEKWHQQWLPFTVIIPGSALFCLRAFCLSWHHLLCCSNCLKTHKLKNFFSPQKIPRQPIESSKNMPERIPHPEQYLRSSCSCAYPTHCKLRRASLRQGPCPRVLPLLSTPWVCRSVGILVHGAKSFYCLRTDASLPGLQKKSREK